MRLKPVTKNDLSLDDILQWAVLRSIVSCLLFENERNKTGGKTEPNPETENERQRDKELNSEWRER